MPNTSDKLQIRLLINNQPYTYTVLREKEELFRKAADLINSKFNKYRTAQPNHSAERYSTTVLVDIAVQLLQQQKDKSVDPIVTSMKQLNTEVEEVLNEE